MSVPAENQHRPWTDREYHLLKQATKTAIKSCGGLESASLITRVGHSELARYYDPAEKLFMPIDVAADLERDTGIPVVTRTLANLLEYELVTAPPLEYCPDEHQHWSALIAILGKETAAALESIANALAQYGTLSSDAINEYRLTKHINEVIQAGIQLKSAMAQRERHADRYRKARRTPTVKAPDSDKLR